jgi:hypothetical protein
MACHTVAAWRFLVERSRLFFTIGRPMQDRSRCVV